MIVDLSVGINYNDGTPTEWVEWRQIVSYELGVIYNRAIRNKIPLDSVAELQDALKEIREHVEDTIVNDMIKQGVEYACKCEGIVPVDPVEINDLVAKRDKGALKFLKLQNATEDELNNWDASKLDALPLVRDFYDGFGTHSPFDGDWELFVEFLEPEE